MVNHDDMCSSVLPTSRPLALVHPLSINEVDDGLAAAQQSDVTVRANSYLPLALPLCITRVPDPSDLPT